MLRREKKERNLRCNFCGKRSDQVEKLIAGPKVYICDECVAMCTEILAGGGAPLDGDEAD